MICSPCSRGIHRACLLGECECPQRIATEADERAGGLRSAAPDLLAELKKADALLTTCCAVLKSAAIADHIPFDLNDSLDKWLRSGSSNGAIAKAEGRA